MTKVCRFAHEGDGFKKLVSLTLMICNKKNNSEVTSTTKRRWSKGPNNATKENSVQSQARNGDRYDPLLDGLTTRAKKKRDEGSNGDVTL